VISEERLQALEALAALSEQYPDKPLGELVANVACWAWGLERDAVWKVSDEAFLRAIEEHLRQRGR